jgi:pimeloyl-ACP methyl ester carboxylesterase
LHPLVIWLGGGFSNSISEVFWQPADPANDQSAAAFRQEKLLMMYPSFRGGNDNPGGFELFYGEVEDVLAAADHAAGLSYVDPQRIYLGGHSTGATLALLAAAMPKAKFRAVFAFGPVEDPQGYSLEKFPFDPRIQAEFALRAPAHYINTIRRRTYVIEGVEGNVTALRKLKEACKQPDITFVEVDGNHFSILAPLTKFLAGKVKADKSPAFSLEIAPLEWAEAIPR